jgi:hypothetical protein
MTMSTRNVSLFACLAVLLLAGCPEPLEPPNAVISVFDPAAAAVVDAGVPAPGACAPIAVPIDGFVRTAPAISGACSSDPGGADLSYAWSLTLVPPGSHAEIVDPALQVPTFEPDMAGSYHVRLVVSNGTLTSAPAEVIVNVAVGACGDNAPTATAAVAVAAVNPGAGVQLQATAVNDPDNAAPCSANQLFTYAWRLARVPAGSAAVLNDASSEYPAFVADVPGDYVAELIVTDSTGMSSAPTTVTVTASVCGTARPVAVAEKLNPGTTAACGGAAIAVDMGGGGGGGNNRIHVSAAASSDADNAGTCNLGQTLFYRWTVLTAPWDGSWTLSSAEGMTTDVSVRTNGAYSVRLLVTDSAGLVSNETVCQFNVTNVP